MKKLFVFVSLAACFSAAFLTSCSQEDFFSASKEAIGTRSDSHFVVSMPDDPHFRVQIYNPDGMENSLDIKIRNYHCYVPHPLYPDRTILDEDVYNATRKYLPDYYCVPSWNDLELHPCVKGTYGCGVEIDPEFDDVEYILSTLNDWKAPALQELKAYTESTGLYMLPPSVTCAGIGSGAKVYADKVLFGREPGEDLTDMFYVDCNVSNSMILTYPAFEVVRNCVTAESPVLLSEFLTEGNALFAAGMSARFLRMPEECYDLVTFTVEIPVTYQRWRQYFNHKDCQYRVKEGRWDVPTNYKVLKGTVRVKVGE